MSKRKKSLYLSLVPLLLLTSCGEKQYPLSDYRLTMEYEDNFKILQWTDIHIGNQSNTNEILDVLRADFAYANNPDLIVMTGDTFMGATKGQIDTFFDFMETLMITDSHGKQVKVPFAFTYGNHDIQGNYDSDFIAKRISQCENAMFIDYEDDNIFGRTNYCIDLLEGETVKYRLYILDSNAYVQTGFGFGYDHIHDDQLDQMKNLHDTYGDAPALAFFHIPVYEFEDAYNMIDSLPHDPNGEKHEKVSYPVERTDAFTRMKTESNVQGMFVGHDHVNNYTVEYQGVVLSYGTRCTDQVYGDKTGVTTIILDDTKDFDYTDVHKDFIYREGGKAA